MDVSKIVRLVALLIALVAAFVDLPEEAGIIALAGLIGGWFVEQERATNFLVMVLALALVNAALGPIWGIGETVLNPILASVSDLVNAAACTVIVVGIYERLKP
ncbi:MAG: hypothetical protein ACE5OQ_13390 [Woeseia sp.]